MPFASQWKPGPVAWGIAAMWLFVAVEVSSLAMRRLPRRAWRAIHLTSYLAAILTTVHTLTAGTERDHPAVMAIAVLTPAATGFFLVYRWLLPKRKRRAAALARSAG